MTNAAVAVVVMIVTNWGAPSIPQAKWDEVAQGTVPAARERSATIERIHKATVEAEGTTKEVILKKEIIGYLSQVGISVERVYWNGTVQQKMVKTIVEGGRETVVVIDKVLESTLIPKKEVVVPPIAIPEEEEVQEESE